MTVSSVTLLCFFDGKLINDDKNAEYVGGNRKLGNISNSIGFIEFKQKIQTIIKLSNEIGFKIKCGVYFNENTMIAADVDDDESLKDILDRPESITPLRAYIIKEQSPLTTTTTQRDSSMLSNIQKEPVGADAMNISEYISHSASSLLHIEEILAPWNVDDHLGINNFLEDVSDINCARNENPISWGGNVPLPQMEEVVVSGPTPTEESLPPLPTATNSLQSTVNDDHVPLQDGHGFYMGQPFPDVYTFRDALSTVSVRTKRELKPVKTTKFKVAVKCNADGCCWYIQANRVPESPTFRVEKYCNVHTCDQRKSDDDHRQANSNWIASRMKSAIKENPNIMPKEIVAAIQKEFGIQISYEKAVKARVKAWEVAFEESFRFLPGLVEELRRNGSVAELCQTIDYRFLYLFWAFRACIDAFRTRLRPMLQIDIMPLKFGVLMTASAFDGDSYKVPVAFGIFETDEIPWLEEFLSSLKQFIIPDFHFGHQFSIFTKYFGKELVHKVFPGVVHEDSFSPDVCSVEIKDTELQEWMAEAASIGHGQGCNLLLDKMQKENKDFYSWCHSRRNTQEGRDLFVWLNYQNGIPTRSHKDIRKDASSLYASLYENDMRKLTSLPITELVMSTGEKIARYFRDRRSRGARMMTKFTPCSEFLLEITTEYANDKVERFFPEYGVGCNQQLVEVNLETRTCDCMEFQLRGRPCIHAAEVILQRGLEMANYFHDWFTAETYRATYAYDVRPILDCSQQQQSRDPGFRILPPKWKLCRKDVGRPRKSKQHLLQNVIAE